MSAIYSSLLFLAFWSAMPVKIFPASNLIQPAISKKDRTALQTRRTALKSLSGLNYLLPPKSGAQLRGRVCDVMALITDSIVAAAFEMKDASVWDRLWIQCATFVPPALPFD